MKRKHDFYHLSDNNIDNNIELENDVLSSMWIPDNNSVW